MEEEEDDDDELLHLVTLNRALVIFNYVLLDT
jgi:hypothetical protein